MRRLMVFTLERALAALGAELAELDNTLALPDIHRKDRARALAKQRGEIARQHDAMEQRRLEAQVALEAKRGQRPA